MYLVRLVLKTAGKKWNVIVADSFREYLRTVSAWAAAFQTSPSLFMPDKRTPGFNCDFLQRNVPLDFLASPQ